MSATFITFPIDIRQYTRPITSVARKDYKVFILHTCTFNLYISII